MKKENEKFELNSDPAIVLIIDGLTGYAWLFRHGHFNSRPFIGDFSSHPRAQSNQLMILLFNNTLVLQVNCARRTYYMDIKSLDGVDG